VSEVNADKSIDLIGRVKSTNVTKSSNKLVAVVSAIPGIERRILYFGKD